MWVSGVDKKKIYMIFLCFEIIMSAQKPVKMYWTSVGTFEVLDGNHFLSQIKSDGQISSRTKFCENTPTGGCF